MLVRNKKVSQSYWKMAEHLASIFGTEKDRVNCPFFFKIGACRHWDRCSRLHTKPSIAPTLLLSNMYQRPDMITPGVDVHGNLIDPCKIQEHFKVGHFGDYWCNLGLLLLNFEILLLRDCNLEIMWDFLLIKYFADNVCICEIFAGLLWRSFWRVE